MTALAAKLRLERFGPASAFIRRWTPVVLSALPFWSSGQSAYATLVVALTAGALTAALGFWLLAPFSAALAVRAVFDRRSLGLWFSAVFSVYVVVEWCLTGFCAGAPWDWVWLWRTWFANEPISLWIPVCTGCAAIVLLGPTRAGGDRIDLSFPRLRAPHFVGFPAACVALTAALGCYGKPSGVFGRIGLVLGIVVVMSFAAKLYRSVSTKLRSDSKRLAVTEVQREEPAASPSARIASLVQPVSVELDDAFALNGSEEMVMPTVPVGIREGGAFEQTPEPREMFPQQGDVLGAGDKLSVAAWEVLDEGGDPDAEDDPYGLMRPAYQEVAGAVEARRAARQETHLIAIQVEPPVPSLPADPELSREILETLRPLSEPEVDLSESGIFDVVEAVPLDPGPPVSTPAIAAVAAPAPLAITIGADIPDPVAPALPETLQIAIGDSEPLMNEEIADDPSSVQTALPDGGSSSAPAEPGSVLVPYLTSLAPRLEDLEPFERAMPRVQTPASGHPMRAELDNVSAAKSILEQPLEADTLLSNADAVALKRMRSVCIRMITAYTRINSVGGSDAEIMRLIVPFVTPAHEAMLDEFGGRDLRLALERLRLPPHVEVPAVAMSPIGSGDRTPLEVADHGPGLEPSVGTPNEAALSASGSAGPVGAMAEGGSVVDGTADGSVSAGASDALRPSDVLVEVPMVALAPTVALPPTVAQVPPQPHQVVPAEEPPPAEPAVFPPPAGETPAIPDFDLGEVLVTVPDLDPGPVFEPESPRAEHAPGTAASTAASIVVPAARDAAAAEPLAAASEPDVSEPIVVLAAVPDVSPVPNRDRSVPGFGAPSAPAGDPARHNTASQIVEPMQPVFEIDGFLERPVEEASASADAVVGLPSATDADDALVSVDDARAMAAITEWMALQPVGELDLERIMQDLGRGPPDDMEIEFLTRKLSEYEPSPFSFRGLDAILSTIMNRRNEQQPYSRDDVAMAKGLVCLISSHVFDRWRFTSREQMLARLAFFFCDPFTRRLVAKVEAWLKDGFETQGQVKQARSYMGTLESFYLAYPDREPELRELHAQLDMAEYNFAHSAGATGELVHEGLHSVSARDVAAATDLARSRLLMGSLPPSVQDGVTRFLAIASVIDEIDLMIKRESMKHKAATEQHPLHSALMELEYRGVGLINDLRSNLVRRENLLDQLPALIRGRNEDAAHLFERLKANAEAISDAVVESRDRVLAAAKSGTEIQVLRAAVAERDESLEDLRKQISQRVVMDALVASAGIIAEREPRLELVERKGLARLRAVLDRDVQVAVVFVHGLDSKWTVMSGSRLEMQGTRGQVVQSFDLLAMREAIRNTHLFSDAKALRLRVVIEAGDLAGGRTDYVFTRQDVIVDPSKLLEESDFDNL